MLILVYTFNFIDRQIVGILAVPIKAEFDLSDTQLGLMGGLAFALFYTVLGIPIARLADRINRVSIMAIALGLWSVMTAACGFAGSFAQLFVARLGVGVGEAGGVAPAYALICDYFPPRERARALAAYSFGIPIGAASGIVIGGFITHLLNWRTAFIVVGVAGLVLTPLLKFTVREPPRGQYDQPAASPPPRLLDTLVILARKPTFWGLSIAAACSSMMGYGLFFWMPSFMVRSFGLTLLQASLGFGALILVGGLCGIWLGGVIADRFGGERKAVYALIPGIAFLGAIPFYAVGVLAKTLGLSAVILLIPTALGLAWLGPVLTAIQHLVPSTMRATASAVFLFINNLIGIGLGTTLIGALSDALHTRAGVDSLRYAILAGTGFYVIAAILFLLTSRRLEREWVD
jgi:MFS family permease